MPLPSSLFDNWVHHAAGENAEDFDDLTETVKEEVQEHGVTPEQALSMVLLLLSEREYVTRRVAEVLSSTTFDAKGEPYLYASEIPGIGQFLYQKIPLHAFHHADLLRRLKADFPRMTSVPEVYPRILFQRGAVLRCVTRIQPMNWTPTFA